MKMNSILLTVVSIQTILLVVVLVLFFNKPRQQSAYIATNEVISSFDLSKELDAKMKKVQTERKNILDSLELRVKQLSVKVQAGNAALQDSFLVKRDEFLLKQRQFTEDNQRLQQEFQTQIYTQLNQYIQDYNKEAGYDYILGASGNGTVMAADEENNITEEVIAYVNNKYKGVQ